MQVPLRQEARERYMMNSSAAGNRKNSYTASAEQEKTPFAEGSQFGFPREGLLPVVNIELEERQLRLGQLEVAQDVAVGAARVGLALGPVEDVVAARRQVEHRGDRVRQVALERLVVEDQFIVELV
eukprot:CAMPEP_0184386918 /NCGR_PEP_ID=MMETSP0007-20130409/10249_1 /TAXON_ID=97485 /ORGANISM="Prymnesium parvum, Strain Texoma1" /LENGTH=125 /DNA_ID=CAMNT_0026735023 /DNA_START=306 /DNA_END=678 /DNA_ORIENTATION=-